MGPPRHCSLHTIGGDAQPHSDTQQVPPPNSVHFLGPPESPKLKEWGAISSPRLHPVTIKLYLTQGDVEHQLQEWLREGETKRRTNTQEAPPPLACSVWVNASNQKKGSTSHPIWLCALRAFLTLGRAFWAAQCVPLASLSLAHLPARENSSARALPPQRHLPPRWPLASNRNSYGVGGSGCCWGQPRTTPPPQGRETTPDPPKPLEN